MFIMRVILVIISLALPNVDREFRVAKQRVPGEGFHATYTIHTYQALLYELLAVPHLPMRLTLSQSERPTH
jgi:hypothetical protein